MSGNTWLKSTVGRLFCNVLKILTSIAFLIHVEFALTVLPVGAEASVGDVLGKELVSPRQTRSSLIPRLSSPERDWEELRCDIQEPTDHRSLIVAQTEPAMAF
jgi:hypothetical protein